MNSYGTLIIYIQVLVLTSMNKTEWKPRIACKVYSLTLDDAMKYVGTHKADCSGRSGEYFYEYRPGAILI